MYSTLVCLYLIALFGFSVALVRRANKRSRAAESEARSYERAADAAKRDADASRRSAAEFAKQAHAFAEENARLRGTILDLTSAPGDKPEKTIVGLGVPMGQRVSRPKSPPPMKIEPSEKKVS